MPKLSTFRIPVIFFILSSISLTIVQGNQNVDDLLEEWWTTVSTSYPRYEDTTSLLNTIKETLPKHMNLYSVGKTFEKREMWVIRLSKDLSKPRPLLVPQVKIVANMHGDETLGRALVLMLAVDILKQYHEKNPRVVNLLQNTDIHLMPSVNPDGFDASEEGVCEPNPNAKGRQTHNNKDLNRDFPDQFQHLDKDFRSLLSGREIETQNMMKWITSTYFVLSANLHALTLVASYPFDSLPLEIADDPSYQGAGVISRSPDHDVFFHLATKYSKNHKLMHKQNDCSKGAFKNGVTNGAEWYNVRGGMQDFAYTHGNCMEITFELSCCKFPAASTLLTEWDNNIEALYGYLEGVQMGVKGMVTDPKGKPVWNAKVYVKSINHSIRTTAQGEYWRLLMPGKYQMWATGHGHAPSMMVDIIIPNGAKGPIRQDFRLSPQNKGRSFRKNPVHER